MSATLEAGVTNHMFRKTIYLISLINIIMFGCSKVKDSDNDENEVFSSIDSVTVSNSDTLLYTLGVYGDECGAGIYKQAKHYIISETYRDTIHHEEIIFRYMADSSFTGMDYVEFKSQCGWPGKILTHIKKLHIEVIP